MAFFLILFLLFTSCASQNVLNIPVAEAETMLYSGDIAFILKGRLKNMRQVSRIDSSAPFYAALLLNDYEKTNAGESKDAGEKVNALLNSALKSPITRVAAANILIPKDPDFYFANFKQNTQAALAASAPGNEWEEAFMLLSLPDDTKDSEAYKDALRDYFFVPRRTKGTELKAAKWLLEKLEAAENPPLNGRDSAGVRGRFLIAARDYGPAYKQFRISAGLEPVPAGENKAAVAAAEDSPALPPLPFVIYPELLNDFARAIQYGGPLNEGIKLFTAYDTRIKSAISAGEIEKEAGKKARYLLNYYMGRFYRAQGNHTKAVESFTAALELAPDALQQDACIWYIIDVHYAQKPENSIAQIKKYASRWNDAAYFDDILNKLAFYSSSKKKWQNMIDIYPAVFSKASPALRAKYAYVIARALEEGYVKTRMEGINAANLFAAAYEQESDYYYRAMAAKKLKKSPAITKLVEDGGHYIEEADAPLDMQFLLGFFKFGSARFASAYISDKYDMLSIPELRLLAKKFTDAGRYGDSIRLVVKYRQRSDFELSRTDLELAYPRAFSDLVERYARKTKMEENYLYALMREESIFIPDIVSHAGALGLTQLMPATGRQMAEILARNGGPNYIEDDKIDFFNPELNIHLGALYYKDMEMRMGSTQSALMAYNGGIGRVGRWKRSSRNMPEDLFAETIEIKETREYSKKVISAATVYQFLYY